MLVTAKAKRKRARQQAARIEKLTDRVKRDLKVYRQRIGRPHTSYPDLKPSQRREVDHYLNALKVLRTGIVTKDWMHRQRELLQPQRKAYDDELAATVRPEFADTLRRQLTASLKKKHQVVKLDAMRRMIDYLDDLL